MLSMDFAEMYDFDERPERAMEMLKLVGLERFANKLADPGFHGTATTGSDRASAGL